MKFLTSLLKRHCEQNTPFDPSTLDSRAYAQDEQCEGRFLFPFALSVGTEVEGWTVVKKFLNSLSNRSRNDGKGYIKALKLLTVLLTVSLVSCTTKELPELSIESVSIYAEPEANQNSAIAVDLVMVYNADLLKTIGKMSAAKYFAASRQLLLDNPSLLDIWRWELIPGQMVAGFVPDHDKGDAYGAYIFANYLTPGDHRIKVGPDGVVNILLLRDDMQNIAMTDAHDIKMGTTMSSLTCAKDMCGYNDCCQEPAVNPTLSYQQTGPCAGTFPTCQRRALPPCPQQVPCPTLSQPAQIITRPLGPPCEDTLLGY